MTFHPRFQIILNELQAAYPEADRQKKLQILSLSPYGFEKTMEFFNTSNHMVSTARHLKQDHGILPEVAALSKGRPITPHIKQKVVSFFEDDNISRLCPGQRDCIAVQNMNGSKEKKQKRLILGNLKEIYQKFKEEEGSPDIGFSTFCSLRPKYCILAGSSGTHTVCVCTYHQNPKLQLNAIGEAQLTLEHVIGKAVCNMNQEACIGRHLAELVACD